MRKRQLLIILALALITPLAGANPTGAEVVSGTATFSQPDANVLNITNTNNTIINWQSFDIGVGQTTNFIQPSSSSAVLNQVISNNPSEILGNLNSNGQVFLVNQHGLLIGEGAQINTAGFFGSTLNITDEDFLNGNLSFSGGGSGGIENLGYIYAGEGGNVVLIAPNITNGGVIEVDQGNIILAAGESITLTSLENSSIRFDVQSPDNSVTNLGSIIANNGAASLFAGTLTHSGSITATGLVQNGDGTISLVAIEDNHVTDSATLIADGASGGNITVQSQQGDLYFYGNASAQGESQSGGTIALLGDRVGLFGSASVDASGATDGGEVLIGGDYQGQGETQTAWQTQVSADAVIRADAIESGNGGKVIVWADEYTLFNGTASATGGVYSGDGGFIEISGKDNLNFDGYVDTTAANGTSGTVLFDPKNIFIANAGSNYTGVTADTDTFLELPATNVTFTPGSIASILRVQDVFLQANNDIFIFDDLIIGSSGAGFDLSLQAGRSIDIRANIFTDNGNLILKANDSSANLVTGERDPGIAQITMTSGKILDTGTGNIDITMDAGVGTNGNITLASIRAASLDITSLLTGTGVTTSGITSFLSGSLSNVTWTNSGIAVWDNNVGANFTMTGANIINTGIFSIDVKGAGGRTVSLADTGSSFTNRGLLIISSSTDSDKVDFSLPFVNQGGAIAINSGIFSLNSGTTPLMLDAGSSLQGNGEFLGDVFNNAGIVTAGTAFDFAGAFSTGTLTITGNYTQGVNGQLLIKLDTTINGLQSDVFNITGMFAADGDIALIPINNATALEIVLMVGQSFTPLNVGGFTGTFASLTIPPGMGVTVDSLGVFTIVATSETLSQLSAELDRMIEEGEFSVEEYFYQIALLQQLVIDRKAEELKLALSRLICK